MSEGNPQWTPGPWKVHEHEHMDGELWLTVLRGAWDITHNGASDPGVIADAKYSGMTPEENEANAHLIAAAPDLYDALRPLGETRLRPATADRINAIIIEATGDGELAAHVHHLLTDGAAQARRALAKARGEEAERD